MKYVRIETHDTHADCRQLSFIYCPCYLDPGVEDMAVAPRGCAGTVQKVLMYAAKKFGHLVSQRTVTCRNRWDEFLPAPSVAV